MSIKVNQDSWLVSIGQFVAWMVSSILAVISGLYLREAFLSIANALQIEANQAYDRSGGFGLNFSSGYMVSLLDNILLFVVGIGVIVAVIAIEYFFRKGRARGLLLKRIGLVLGIEVAIIVVSVLIRTIV